ncbi:hypothetical protein DFP73DRAFT_593398 [Morchella snyderi]|nr:hypothetical protein DFP73DRAFT_593398 [Morchella snyderi]
MSKRVRGYLPSLELGARRQRRQFEPPSPPLPREQDAINPEPASIWDDVLDEEALAQNLATVIDEDLERVPDEIQSIHRPVQTNLLGMKWGEDTQDAKENEIYPGEASYGKSATRTGTIGGGVIDGELEINELEGEAAEEGEEEDTLYEELEDASAIRSEAPVPEAQEIYQLGGGEILVEPALAEPITTQVGAEGPDLLGEPQKEGEETVVDGKDKSYFDTCGEEFHLAMMLFVTSADLSTTQYEALTEVLALATVETLKALPKSIRTLQQRCRRTFPLMSLKAQMVDVDSRQIPPKKENPRRAYYFDPSEYCRLWLSSDQMQNKIHQGFGEFVDVASEIWHGDSWKESVRTTSGHVVFIQEKVILLPSDCVRYINSEGNMSLGRVKGIGVDKRQGKVQQPCALINPLVPPHLLRARWEPADATPDPFPEYPWADSHLPELILVEERQIVPCTDIVCHEWVYFTDYPSVTALRESLLPEPPTFCVRLIAYQHRGYHIRPVHKRHRVIAEQELAVLTRDYVLNNMFTVPDNDNGTQSDTARPNQLRRISIPYSVFLDGFGLYRNAYYSLKGMYITPTGLDEYERSRLYNMYVLMIGPFGSNEQQMAKCVEENAHIMGRGTCIRLESGEDVFVTAFPQVLIGDMPQQNQNSGAKTHKAVYGCRSCFVPDVQRNSLMFNTSHNGRYRQHVQFIFKTAHSKGSRARDTILQRAGLSASGPYFDNAYTMLDAQRSTPNDPMHAELRLCKYFEEALLEGILSADGLKAYLAAWDVVQVPYGWGQPQNPVTHKGSMVFNEHGRIAIINPFVLMHMFTNDDWYYRTTDIDNELSPGELHAIRVSYIKKVAYRRLSDEFGHAMPALKAIVNTAWSLARCVTLTMQETISTEERAEFRDIVIHSRTMLQKIFMCASADTKTFKNYANVPNIHLALHYLDDMENFGTARNSSTMMGEQKHKVFKLHARHTNTRDNDMQLMRATNTAQTIRFILNGAFALSAPNITGQMQGIVKKCPLMCSRFLGAETKEEADRDLNGSVDCVQTLFKRAEPGIPIARRKVPEFSADYSNDSAFKAEYGLDIMPSMNKKMHYWNYFSAVEKGRRNRVLKLRPNQVVSLRDRSFHYLTRIYTVKIGGSVRVMFVMKPLQRVPDDSAYEVFRLHEEEQEITVGLRNIDSVMLHFVVKAHKPKTWWYNPYMPNFM